jgi:membrane protein DedA with SNARE-associated domain
LNELIEQAGLFIETNQAWAGPIIALLTLGESLIIIGLFIPATALLLLTGGLIGAGTLPLIPILLWGIAGAIVGDAISYYLGRWMGPSVVRRWPLNTQRSAVARARLFFYRYGFVSILVGRFLGPIRSTIPLVAGVMSMSNMRFQLANVISAILWLPLMMAPGYLTAKGVEHAGNSQQLGLFIGSAISVLVGVWLIILMVKKRRNPSQRR